MLRALQRASRFHGAAAHNRSAMVSAGRRTWSNAGTLDDHVRRAEHQLGANSSSFARVLLQAARVKSADGLHDDAIGMTRRAVNVFASAQSREDGSDLHNAMRQLATALTDASRLAEAEVAWAELIGSLTRSGDKGSALFEALVYQAMTFYKGDKTDKARASCFDALAAGMKLSAQRADAYAEHAARLKRAGSELANDQRHYAVAHRCLGVVLIGLQEPSKARVALTETVRLLRDIPGEDVELAGALVDLSGTMEPAQALAHLDEALDILERQAAAGGKRNFTLGMALIIKANVVHAQGDTARGSVLAKSAIQYLERVVPASHPLIVVSKAKFLL